MILRFTSFGSEGVQEDAAQSIPPFIDSRPSQQSTMVCQILPTRISISFFSSSSSSGTSLSEQTRRRWMEGPVECQCGTNLPSRSVVKWLVDSVPRGSCASSSLESFHSSTPILLCPKILPCPWLIPSSELFFGWDTKKGWNPSGGMLFGLVLYGWLKPDWSRRCDA